jgi:predicted nucleic acid-binding protein
MNALSHLDQVTAELEGSVNINRMKKLLYFVVYGKWEVSETKLTDVKLKDLVREVIGLNYNLEQLEGLLKDICSKINKQVEYLAISGEIIQKIAPIYLETSEIISSAGNSSNGSNGDSSIDNLLVSHQQAALLTRLYDVDEKKQVQNDLFEVRLKLVQRTNPLRVKILIFSAIDRLFTFSESDWSALKKHRLDELLEKLLRKCPSKKDLENQLYQTAKKFENKNENIQVASAIVKYLGLLYEKNTPQVMHHQVSAEIPEKVTTHFSDQPVKDDSDFSNLISFHPQAEEEAIAHANNGSIPTQSPIDSWSSGDEVASVEYHQYPGQVYAGEDEITIPELHTNASEHFSAESELLEKQYGDELMNSPAPYSLSFVSKTTSKITASLKQHLVLEEEINHLVSMQVNRLAEEIENGLSELEEMLDDRLRNQEVFQASSLKYNSMKQMMVQIQAKTSKYLDLLNQMQQAELQDLKAVSNHSSPGQNSAISAETTEEESDDDPEAKLLQLAKEGNAKAIAALMNQTLKGRGINTLATIKNECLHIVLESEQELNQKASINVVRKNVVPLEITSITKVKVHWRKTGSKSPVWSHEFTYIVDG